MRSSRSQEAHHLRMGGRSRGPDSRGARQGRTGRRRASAFIDFNSQLMCVNIGHGDPRVVKAIQDQAEVLTYVTPAMATEPRATGREARRAHAGRSRRLSDQRRRGGQRERLQDRARAHGPPEDPRSIPLVSWRHRGATSATGEPRSWSQAPLPGIVHVLDPYHGIERGGNRQSALRYLDEVIQLEGPHTIAAFILESVTEPTGSSFHPTVTCRACERCATNTASS